ncbi:MAG TPA: hypothetical protein PLW01_11005, partial [Agitococcus sp.]|nr:hypothetical protein [Agitococcus sp.]
KVARLITKAEKVEVVKKAKAMLKAGEIHLKVQANYQDIMVLVQHVIIHCVYRNVLRCKTFKHALNFAAKAIRNGTWTTPKRIVQAEINHREQQAREANELELRKSLGSGLGKILGEAVRVQNGLSDADIAKAKAAILEHGIRELGANATKNDIDALKTILQKSIDRKRSKSRE